ncbi:hypothetical protein [Nocardia transvalensis]|uniref:hypothetical protein n=1 Tax=Nocardia transvalensis TaxID=37333 RepID=UPI00189345EE|nr:hypothetical protein [Nocardia transvalensis]MBF6332792.1 hypothetical protein [Nocardia transvalensis]
MRLVPEAVLGMARTIEPTADATKAHATRIADVGFEPAHAGQDYLEQGQKLAAGVEGIVTMLQSWSEASAATAQAMRQTVTATVSKDQENRDRIAAAGEQGPA